LLHERSGSGAGTVEVASLADAALCLSNVQGALTMIDEPGLAALVQLLRAQILTCGKTGSASCQDAARVAQGLHHIVRQVLGDLLRGRRPVAGELLSCWRDIAALGGVVELHPSVLVSLHISPGTLPPSLPSNPSGDGLADLEPALLSFLRAQDDTQLGAAARSIADLLIPVCTQDSERDEQARWLALRAYLIEFALVGGDPVRAKKIVAAIARATRYASNRSIVLASLARDALFELAQRACVSDEAREVALLFNLQQQFTPDHFSVQERLHADTSATGLSEAVNAAIGSADLDPDSLFDAGIWRALADVAELCARYSAVTIALRHIATQLNERSNDLRESLAAALLCMQVCASTEDTAEDDISALAQAMSAGDPSRMLQSLREWSAIASAQSLMREFSSTLCLEMASAEQVLDTSNDMQSARTYAVATLTRIAGALQMLALDAERDTALALRARFVASDASVVGIDDEITQKWVQLQECFVLLPWCIDESHQLSVEKAIEEKVVLAEAEDSHGINAIFFSEATGLLHDLRTHSAASDSAALMHVAHTLAGCSATVGAMGIAELAHAMEEALARGYAPDPLLLQESLRQFDVLLVEFAHGARDTSASPIADRWRQCMPANMDAATDTSDTETSDKETSDKETSVTEAGVTEAGVTEQDDINDAAALAGIPANVGTDREPECQIDALDTVVPRAAEPDITQLDGWTDKHSLAATSPLEPVASDMTGDLTDDATDHLMDGESELLAIFNEEAADLLPQIEQAVLIWQHQPGDPEPPARLLRVLHTLKGSARMAGRQELGEEFHRAEAEIGALTQQPAAAIAAQLPALLARIDGWLQAISVKQAPRPGPTATPEAGQPAEASALAPGDIPSPLLRVRADRLAQFADSSAEVWVGNARLREGLQEQKRLVADLSDDLTRLRTQLRELEIEAESRILSHAAQQSPADFDPLEFDRYTRLHELTRMMAESITDIAGVQRGLSRQVEVLGLDVSAQARDLRRQQAELQSLRSQSLRSAESRLTHLLRQASREVARDTEFILEGGDVEIERGLLDRLMGPLEHLLRNAVVHGIEPPDERLRRGKPSTGRVTLAAAIAGSELSLTLSDDGGGIDTARIRARALAAGLLREGEATDERTLTALIFEPGFSTASEVTALSGRGIGMDAVRAELQALGGRIEVSSELGRGCCFSIRLPIALASVQVVLATAGMWRIALPAQLLQQVLQVDPLQIQRGNDGALIDWQGISVRLIHLGHALGDEGTRTDSRRVPVAVLRDGERLLAVQLEAVDGQREVILKRPGAQLAQVLGLAGATLLGDGGIALVIDPFHLPAATPLPTTEIRRAPLVLVVDDSLTVRRASQRLLERHGYAVALARDGIEAFEYVQQQSPVAVLLDIEMPRMDGFELLAVLRDDVRFRALPVVMITSRIAERHRERAMALGATAYMGKPYDEDALLALLAGVCMPEVAIA
jgi:chemotaxis protein histidine kinase CheA/ActR/RegA family two-component response regulator